MVYTRAPEDLLVEMRERIKAMRTQEATHYAVPDYLDPAWQQKLRDVPPLSAGAVAPSSASAHRAGTAALSAASAASATSQINEVWREKICEWCFQVVDHFDFNREIVSVAMSYLDRYLARRTVDRRIFQLAAMTALYLAIKLYEPGKLRMTSLIDLSRGYFMAEHVVAMESSMLQSLRWHVHPPTPHAFCRDLLRLVPGEVPSRAREDAHEMALFMTELSVCDYWFVAQKPSAIALAAVLNALELQVQGPRRLAPECTAAFLRRAADVGMDAATDAEIVACGARLRETYNVAGGYAHTPEDVDDEAGARVRDVEDDAGDRVAIVSPTGVADGPDADDSEDDAPDASTEEYASKMECA